MADQSKLDSLVPRRRRALPQATSAFYRMADPRGLGVMARALEPRPVQMIGEGFARDYTTGEVFPPPPEYESARRQRHVERMRETAALFGLQQGVKEKAPVPESTAKDLAQGRANYELVSDTLQQMKDLQAAGGNVGKEGVDALAGFLETLGADQPARWIERGGYDEIEEEIRPQLRASFMSMFNDMQKGAASDTDLQRMSILDPSQRGLSMQQRLNNLRLAGRMYGDYLTNLASGRRMPGTQEPFQLSPLEGMAPSAPPRAAAPTAPGGGPRPGTVVGGYRFKGGDPNNQSNWETVR